MRNPSSFLEHNAFTTVIAPLIFVLGIGIVTAALQRRRYNAKYSVPNLIPGLPFIGNVLQLPKEDACLHFEMLAKKHGEMFTLNIGGVYWLFLNSQRVVSDLLEKRASIYSSRMSLPMAQNLISSDKRTLLMPYGDLWRRERKIMHQILNNKNQDAFESFQDIESRALLHNYLTRPEEWHKAHAAFASSVIMSIAFGRRAGLDDHNLQASQGCSEEFVKYLVPGRAVVDILPFLGKIPFLKSLQPWRWYGDDLYRRTTELYRKELDGVRERKKQGTQKQCFMSDFLDQGHDREFAEDELLYIAGALMEAGTDTTRVSLQQLVAASALWPDWVDRARVELDRVCGANAERLPTAEDIKQLPIIRAAVKEVVRWKPLIGDTGIPHALTTDDVYEGYRIPAGTVVTYNHWAISNDPREYAEPERFWPERFINDDLDKPTKGHLGFGAGRRVCVGYNVANTNMSIAIARLIYCMDFAKVDGKLIDVSKPIRGGLDSAPIDVKISVRSEAHRRLIETECREAVL